MLVDTEFALAPYADIIDDTIDEDGNKIWFKFNELNDTAKNIVRDKWREHDLDYDWWEFTYEDVVTIGGLIGIDIANRRSRGSGPITPGKERTESDIRFSGFSSQGDGCCYSGDLFINQLKGCVERIKGHVGHDEQIFTLAAEGEALYEMILIRLVTRRMQGKQNDGGDEVLLDSRVSIEGNDRYYCTATTHAYCIDSDIVDAMDEYVSNFADWIYGQLEKEYDWLTSDECIDEAIESNDCFYAESGSII